MYKYIEKQKELRKSTSLVKEDKSCSYNSSKQYGQNVEHQHNFFMGYSRDLSYGQDEIVKVQVGFLKMVHSPLGHSSVYESSRRDSVLSLIKRISEALLTYLT